MHAITVIYEDDALLAVSKPEGVPTIPSVRGGISALELLESERGRKLFVVHRLDKAVSGALIFAKTADSHRTLNRIFMERTADKFYAAILCGHPRAESGLIDAPLRQFGSGRTGVDLEKGKPCRTEYQLLGAEGDFSLVRVRLITGRRHQIRAHFFSEGAPIAGDLRYGDRAGQSCFPRLLLHSWRIRFNHGGTPLEITAPLPESFLAGARELGLGSYLESF
ncbi:MAG: RluA family pseudouridine synthase [Elusimicrobia bacterium]|nr:RluA family pseudouridine synthase [Elusimicrobiota bacterium]